MVHTTSPLPIFERGDWVAGAESSKPRLNLQGQGFQGAIWLIFCRFLQKFSIFPSWGQWLGSGNVVTHGRQCSAIQAFLAGRQPHLPTLPIFHLGSPALSGLGPGRFAPPGCAAATLGCVVRPFQGPRPAHQGTFWDILNVPLCVSSAGVQVPDLGLAPLLPDGRAVLIPC